MKKSEINELVEILEEAMLFCDLLPQAVDLGKKEALPKIRTHVDERINECVGLLCDKRDSLDDKYYELSERAQDGEKGQELQNEIYEIDSAISSLQGCAADPMRDKGFLKDAIDVIKML